MQVVLYGFGTGWAIEYLPAVIVMAIHACIVVPYSLRYPYTVLATHPLARLWLEVIFPLDVYVFFFLPLFAMIMPSLEHLIPFQQPVFFALSLNVVVRTALLPPLSFLLYFPFPARKHRCLGRLRQRYRQIT
jgi:hypothetical protein